VSFWRLVILNIGRCPTERHVEEPTGRLTRGIPPGSRAVIGDGDERAAHAKCSIANSFDDLGRRRIGLKREHQDGKQNKQTQGSRHYLPRSENVDTR
jgi:hypothetical protein